VNNGYIVESVLFSYFWLGAGLKRAEFDLMGKASMVILSAFLIIEALSQIGLTTSITIQLTKPINNVVSSLIIISCMFGIYGISTDDYRLRYFALLTPTWEMILGGIILLNIKDADKLALIMQATATIILGVISIWCTLNRNQIKPQEASQTKPDDSTSEYAVEVIDLEKKYFVGPIVVPAINGLNLKVRRGEFISIMGPSGCGKSTLLNLIGALDRPTSGKILIDGIDLSTLDDRGLAKLRNEKIGFVFQAYNLINRSTVFRNVELPTLVKRLPKEERARRVMEMLEIVGLSDKANMRPRMLSGGEQQRVAIARALINNPSIILADEPTGNLDSKSGKNVIEFMRKLNREFGTTILVVTHDREIAEMADRIIYLRDGRIIGEKRLSGG